jgi:predicted DNA-binding transcriptional regulator AlpA
MPKKRQPKITTPVKLLSKKEVLSILGVSHVTLWNWITAGLFPQSREIGPPGGNRTKIGWLDTEVYSFLANAPKRKLKGQR